MFPWRKDRPPTPVFLGFSGGLDDKESICNAGDLGSILVFGRSPEGGHGNPFQYPCLENPHGQRSLVGYRSWHHKKSDTTEWQSTAQGNLYFRLMFGVGFFCLFVCLFVCFGQFHLKTSQRKKSKEQSFSPGHFACWRQVSSYIYTHNWAFIKNTSLPIMGLNQLRGKGIVVIYY